MSTETFLLLVAALVLWQRSPKAAKKPAGTDFGPDEPIATWGDGGTVYRRPNGTSYVRHPDGSAEELVQGSDPSAPPSSAGD